MIRKLALIISFVALMASVCAAQESAAPAAQQSVPPAVLQGEYSVTQLLKLMDKDQNGKVSRAEFMKFMNAEFDQLDVNKDGELDVNELTGLHLGPIWRRPGGTSK